MDCAQEQIFLGEGNPLEQMFWTKGTTQFIHNKSVFLHKYAEIWMLSSSETLLKGNTTTYVHDICTNHHLWLLHVWINLKLQTYNATS